MHVDVSSSIGGFRQVTTTSPGFSLLICKRVEQHNSKISPALTSTDLSPSQHSRKRAYITSRRSGIRLSKYLSTVFCEPANSPAGLDSGRLGLCPHLLPAEGHTDSWSPLSPGTPGSTHHQWARQGWGEQTETSPESLASLSPSFLWWVPHTPRV